MPITTPPTAANSSHTDANQQFSVIGVSGTLGTADLAGTAPTVPIGVNAATGAMYVQDLSGASGTTNIQGSVQITGGTINAGTFTSTGTFVNVATGTQQTLGTVGTIPGIGTLTNLGTVGSLVSGSLSNVAMINAGTISMTTGTINGGSIGTILGIAGGSITNLGQVYNAGTVQGLVTGTIGGKAASGAIAVANPVQIAGTDAGGTIYSPIVTTGGIMKVVDTGGTIATGTLQNLVTGTINALAAGTITAGTLTNLVSGTVNALAAGTVTAGTLTNLVSGTINAIAAGTITGGTLQNLVAGTINAGTFALTSYGTTGTLSSTTSLTLGTMPGAGGVALGFTSAAFVGTVQFEASVDNTNWFSIAGMVPGLGGSNFASSYTAGAGTNIWQMNVTGFNSFRARVSNYTSGSAIIYIQAAQAAPEIVRYNQFGIIDANMSGNQAVLLQQEGAPNYAALVGMRTGTLSTGTVNIDPTPIPVRTLITSYGTAGTTGAAVFGTLAGSVGAGTKVYITGFQITGISGTADSSIIIGTFTQTAPSGGTNMVTRVQAVPGGGIARDRSIPFVSGTNGTICYWIGGAGTVYFQVDYWAAT